MIADAVRGRGEPELADELEKTGYAGYADEVAAPAGTRMAGFTDPMADPFADPRA